MASPSNTKRTYSIRDTPAERWSRLYVDVRAGHGRAAIQAALFLNGSAPLPAFLGNLAIAPEPSRSSRAAHSTRRPSPAPWAGAIYCAGIGRVVYGQSEKALREQIGAHE